MNALYDQIRPVWKIRNIKSAAAAAVIASMSCGVALGFVGYDKAGKCASARPVLNKQSIMIARAGDAERMDYSKGYWRVRLDRR